MVEVKTQIVMSGIFCLTAIYIMLILKDADTTVIGPTIVGVIALAIGVMVPSPKIDNKRGVLKW